MSPLTERTLLVSKCLRIACTFGHGTQGAIELIETCNALCMPSYAFALNADGLHIVALNDNDVYYAPRSWLYQVDHSWVYSPLTRSWFHVKKRTDTWVNPPFDTVGVHTLTG